jgi:hypothetical protein
MIVSLFTLLHFPAAASADPDQSALTNAERVFVDLPTVSEVAGGDAEPKPDYSRDALLSAIWTDPYFGEDVPRAPKTFNPFQFTVFGQTFRFMPFLGAMDGAGGSATPFDYVDPFTIAPVSAAYTPKTFRDRWWEWRMKRKMNKESKDE